MRRGTMGKWLQRTLWMALAACIPGSANVRGGRLYATGEPRYDAYFHSVYDLQRDASQWPDEKTMFRKTYVRELQLDPEVSDATLCQATYDRLSEIAATNCPCSLDRENGTMHVTLKPNSRYEANDRIFLQSIETLATRELKRADHLRDVEAQVAPLLRLGRDFQSRVFDDFRKDWNVDPEDIKSELDASMEILMKISQHALAEARGAEDFVADIQRAVDAASLKGMTGGTSSKRATSKPHPRVTDGGTSAPPPSPPAKAAPDSSEVFSP